MARASIFISMATCPPDLHPQTTACSLQGLEQVPDDHRVPAFFYLHLMSTHNLGIRLDRYSQFQPSQKEMVGKLLPTYDPIVLTNSYDNGVVQADAMLRELFQALTRKGYSLWV